MITWFRGGMLDGQGMLLKDKVPIKLVYEYWSKDKSVYERYHFNSVKHTYDLVMRQENPVPLPPEWGETCF